MYCSKCGKGIPDDSVFCYSCGSKVEIKKKQDTVKENSPSIVTPEITPTLQNSTRETISQTISSSSSKTDEKSGQLYNKEKNISNVYKSTVTSKLVVGTLLILSGLIIFIMSFPPDNEDKYGRIFWSIIFIIGGIYCLQKWYSYRRCKIEVNKDGLTFKDNKSDKIIKWEDIENVYHIEVYQKKSMILVLIFLTLYYFLLYFSKDYDFTIVTKDGRILTIDKKIKNYKELVKLIQNNIYELIYYRLRKIYDENGDIQVGDLIINKTGIRRGKKSVLWNDIKNIETSSGIVYINKKGNLIGWWTTSVSKVPNYFVIIPIINQILKGEIST